MTKFVFGQTKIVFVMLIVMFPVSANAQLLWKITGNGLSKPSYLFGTMHYAPAHFIDSIQGLRAVMAEVEQVYGETVSSDTTVNYCTPDESVIEMPGDSVLADLYTEEEQARINHFYYRLSGFDEAESDFMWYYEEFTPGALKSDLITIKHIIMHNVKFVFDSIPSVGFDINFELDAIKNHKAVGALDDPELHRSVISDEFNMGKYSLKEQAKGLLIVIDHYAEANYELYSLMLNYRSQNLALFNDIKNIKKRNEEYRKHKERSCQGRNITWAKKMPAIMEEGSTLFVVGGAHLGNPKEKRGLLQLLCKAGYTLEPVGKTDKWN